MGEVMISYGEKIWTKSDGFKEADNRIMAHIANMLRGPGGPRPGDGQN